MGCNASLPQHKADNVVRIGDLEFDTADPDTRLGSGASCDVFRGIHRDSGREFALKILDKHPVSRRRRSALDEDLAGARTEARLLSQLRPHANVVEMYDFEETTEAATTMLELVGGGDLLTAMEQGFREEDVRCLFRQLLLALEACHGRGIAHRDIKPDNIMLTRPRTDATVKLVDFGFARQHVGPGAARFDSNLGSPMFKAPEIWDSHKRRAGYDGCKTDVWSAGVVLFLMLSGQYPFRCQPRRLPGMSTSEYIRTQKRLLRDAVLTGSLYFAEEVWSEVSPDAMAAVKSMLTVSASARPSVPSCLEFRWFRTSLEGRPALGTARRQLVGFNARRKLRAGFFAVHAAAGTLAGFRGAKAPKPELARRDTSVSAGAAGAASPGTNPATVTPAPDDASMIGGGTLAERPEHAQDSRTRSSDATAPLHEHDSRVATAANVVVRQVSDLAASPAQLRPA